jgi:hypothetical protein
MIVHAIEKADGDDVPKMISALEGWSFEGPKGKQSVRAADHAMIQPMFIVKLEGPSPTELQPHLLRTVPAEAVAPPVRPIQVRPVRRSHVVRRIEPALAVDDLRASAVLPFEPAAPPSPGVSSPFGPAAPFGSPAFAERDARDITPPSVPRVPEPIPGRRVSRLARARPTLSPAGAAALERRPRRRRHAGPAHGVRVRSAVRRSAARARLRLHRRATRATATAPSCFQPGATFAVDGTVVPRFFLPGGIALALWQLAPGHTIEAWSDDFLALTELARELIAGLHGQAPDRVYAVGLSNGGYQVRRAIERSDAFAGALTWNAVMWTPRHNVLRYLPAAIAALEAATPRRTPRARHPARRRRDRRHVRCTSATC